jgi:hypothetical protein
MDWQLSSISQLCASTLPHFSTLEYLTIKNHRPRWQDHMMGQWQDDTIENIQWLELLQPFTFLKNLDLSDDLVHFVAPALEELASENVAEALPALQDILFWAPQPSERLKKAIGKFIAARQISGCPVICRYMDYGITLILVW